MKNGIKLAACIGILACVALIWTGCAGFTTAATTTTAQTNTNLQNGAQITAYGFSCWVLSLSKGDDTDLAEKKVILNNVVTGFNAYIAEGATAATVTTGLASMLPSSEHWQTFKDAITGTLSVLSADSSKSVVTGLVAGIKAAVAAY